MEPIKGRQTSETKNKQGGSKVNRLIKVDELEGQGKRIYEWEQCKKRREDGVSERERRGLSSCEGGESRPEVGEMREVDVLAQANIYVV